MAFRKVFLWLLGFVIFTSALSFVPSYASDSPNELKILTWNIQMLPPFIKMETQKQRRAKAIGEKLKEVADYDVIVFEEAFNHAAYFKIKQRLKKLYPYQFGPANRRYITLRVNSGVMIFSKYPAKKLKEIQFRYKDTFDDKLARKGALLIEVNKNGRVFQVVGTHLNAGGDPYVRAHQVLDIKDLLVKYARPGVPQFLAGDFNIDKGSELYALSMFQLQMQDGPIEGPRPYSVDYVENDYYRIFNGGEERKTIDYILIDPQGVNIESATRTIPDLRSKGWSKTLSGIENLSDHLPVELSVRF